MRLVGVAVALVVGLTACSAEEAGPRTLPALPSAGASASASGGIPSASPSRGGPTTSAASSATATSSSHPATPKMARDFALFFFDQVNRAYRELAPARVASLSTSACGSCAAVVKDIERLSASRHLVDGRRYVLTSAEAAPADELGRVIVDFRFSADPYVERDAAGGVVQEYPKAVPQDGQVMLVAGDQGWRVAAIRVLNG